MPDQITYKDLKEGDWVKVEIEGVIDNEGWLSIPETTYNVVPGALFQAKITKLEPELKKGRAEIKSNGHKGHVIALEGDEAWFRFDDGDRVTFDAASLRNIPEDQP